MMKPQLAWWSSIDNSYYQFIPNIGIQEGKPSGNYPYPDKLVEAIRDKEKNPQKYKNYKYGDHKI
jgi:hypothetical protein